jgi:acyl phosphate:glycerol-3-phosphate acyltransferase
MEIVSHASAALAAYLLGSIPTGYLVARARGLDIRKSGSGNIGATNAFRILGRPAGFLVLGADFLKGFLACAVAAVAIHHHLTSTPTHAIPESVLLLSAVSAVLGHNYTCWLRFRGGKGIATSAGALAALVPAALGIGAAVWIITFALTRYVSLSSIAASITLPIAVWITGGSLTYIGIITALALLALYKHRTNLQRLLDGTEPRVGRSRAKSSSL